MIHNDIEVVKVEWFTSMGNTIGIIIGKDITTKEDKYYMGVGPGISEEEDIKRILEYGTKLNYNRMKHLFR